jgi:5-methylcytosine-specific restriction endonuclease McrA
MKKPRKSPTRTPKGRIVSLLRRLWLYSPERRAAIKREDNTCEECGKKGSKAKGREVVIHAHHLREGGINWNHIEEVIRIQLLCDPSEIAILCKYCHELLHQEEEK